MSNNIHAKYIIFITTIHNFTPLGCKNTPGDYSRIKWRRSTEGNLELLNWIRMVYKIHTEIFKHCNLYRLLNYVFMTF